MVAIALEVFREEVDEHEDWISEYGSIGFWLLPHREPLKGGKVMAVEIIDAAGKLLQIRIRGMLKKADYDRIIQIAKEAIAREGRSARWPFLRDSKDGSGTKSGAM